MLSMLLTLIMLMLGFGMPTQTAPDPIEVPAATSFTIGTGETVEIPIGDINQSSRSYPVIVEEADTAVAVVETETGPSPEGCEPGGCWEPVTAFVTGADGGTTEFTVQQCFVESQGECSPLGDPVTYTITVLA